MGAPKKLKNPVSVTTILEESQHEALKIVAFSKRKTMAELLRDAIQNLIEKEAITDDSRKPARCSARAPSKRKVA